MTDDSTMENDLARFTAFGHGFRWLASMLLDAGAAASSDSKR
jgi:hypothetical protein